MRHFNIPFHHHRNVPVATELSEVLGNTVAGEPEIGWFGEVWQYQNRTNNIDGELLLAFEPEARHRQQRRTSCNYWSTTRPYNMEPASGFHGRFQCSWHGTFCVRATFSYNGINSQNRKQALVHLDNFFLRGLDYNGREVHTGRRTRVKLTERGWIEREAEVEVLE